jgi:hypothetical protein
MLFKKIEKKKGTIQIEEEKNDKIEFINKPNNTFKSKKKGISPLINNINENKIKEKLLGHKIKDLDSVKKNKKFLSEDLLKIIEIDDEVKKVLGLDEKEFEEKKRKQKLKEKEYENDLYKIPDVLLVEDDIEDDHELNLLRLAHAGLIEVPVPLQHKYNELNKTEEGRNSLIDIKFKEELDFLKVLQSMGPSYSKGYKSDIPKKEIFNLNKQFDNAFIATNSRKKRLEKEKRVLENKNFEEF